MFISFVWNGSVKRLIWECCEVRPPSQAKKRILGRSERRGFLCHRCDGPVRRQLALAAIGMDFAAQQCKQARLAAAVGARQADAPTGMDLQVGVCYQAARAAGESEIAELDQARLRAKARILAERTQVRRGGDCFVSVPKSPS